MHCFSPTSGLPRKLIFIGLLYFGINRRNIKKYFFKDLYIFFFYSQHSVKEPGPTLVPEVFKFWVFFLCLSLLLIDNLTKAELDKGTKITRIKKDDFIIMLTNQSNIYRLSREKFDASSS